MSTILSIGTVYLDIISSNFPGEKGIFPDQELVGDSYSFQLGGSALNFAKTTARLGLSPIFIGKIGNDSAGKIVKELAQQSGIKPHFIQSNQVQTNLGINLNTSSGTLMMVLGTANQSLNASEVYNQVIQELPKTSFFYLGGVLKNPTLIPTYVKLAQKAKQHNVQIVLDHGRLTNKTTQKDINLLTQKILPLVNIYLPSEDEFLQLMRTDSLQRAISKLTSLTSAISILKMAEKGSLLFSSAISPQKYSAFKVNVVNPVGAGDTFNAGFIANYAQTNSFQQAITFASATAALKISTDKLPTPKEVEEFIETHEIKNKKEDIE